MVKKTRHQRASILFTEKIQETSRNKIKNGTAKKLIGFGRITDALANQPEFDMLLKKIEKLPTKKK